MGKVRKHISSIKKANIAKNKSSKQRKQDKRKKLKYGKKHTDAEKDPVTYYDFKKIRDKEKQEKIEKAKEKKNKQKPKENIPNDFIPMQSAVDDMLGPEELDAMIRDEDRHLEEMHADDGPSESEQHSRLVSRAQQMLQEAEAEEEETTFGSKAEQLHHLLAVKASERQHAEVAAAAAAAAQPVTHSLLPIKVGGKVIQRELPKQPELCDGDDSGVERDMMEEEEVAAESVEPLKDISVVDILAQRRKKIHEKKVFIGCMAARVTRSPDENMHGLQEIVKLVYESDADVALTVRKMAALSLVVVFRSILPAYKLATMEAPGVKLKKETRAVCQQEGKLLTRYKFFLRGLEAMLTQASRHKYTPLHLKMAGLALRCFCNLLKQHPVFNYSDHIISLLVPYLSHAREDLRKVVVQAFEDMFYDDETGQLSLRLLKVINTYVRKQEFKVQPCILRVLLRLRITRATALDASSARRIEAARETAKVEHNLKKVASRRVVKMSISEKKRRHKVAKLEHKLQGRRREEAKTKQESIQAEILQVLFGLFVSVIKHNPNRRLLGVVLEGLASFGHLVNVEYYCDLLRHLEKVLVTTGLTLLESVHCVQTVFRLQTGLGAAVPNDPTHFSDKLFAMLMQIPLSCEGDAAVLPVLRTLLLVFVSLKGRVSAPQTLGFVKRLVTLALTLTHSHVIPLLMTVRSVMLNHRCTEALLDSGREGGCGVYRPDLDHPVHCNAGMAALWETQLLASSYHSMTQRIAIHLSKGAPLLGEGCLPASFTKLNVEEMYREYDSSSMQLQPLLPPPQHSGASNSSKRNKERLRRAAQHRLSSAMQSLCDGAELEDSYLRIADARGTKRTLSTSDVEEEEDLPVEEVEDEEDESICEHDVLVASNKHTITDRDFFPSLLGYNAANKQQTTEEEREAYPHYLIPYSSEQFETKPAQFVSS